MQGTNKEMMEVLRSQTAGVKATQKLEQQEADTSQEAGVTRGVSRGQKLEPSHRSYWGAKQSKRLFSRKYTHRGEGSIAGTLCTTKRAPLILLPFMKSGLPSKNR